MIPNSFALWNGRKRNNNTNDNQRAIIKKKNSIFCSSYVPPTPITFNFQTVIKTFLCFSIVFRFLNTFQTVYRMPKQMKLEALIVVEIKNKIVFMHYLFSND